MQTLASCLSRIDGLFGFEFNTLLLAIFCR